jgi:hypothetical protein
MSARQYDVVVLGATGYTGKFTAEHIATSLPTDLRWALAGRSRQKLERVAAECKSLNPDRIQPGKKAATLPSPSVLESREPWSANEDLSLSLCDLSLSLL